MHLNPDLLDHDENLSGGKIFRKLKLKLSWVKL